ncbi:MAG: acylphosphatase [Nocardioidaceae bacterium]
MSHNGRIARHVIVHGRVQGVFYRDSCRREALGTGVAGWVRNAYDGTVEAVFEGSPDAVDAMVSWAHEGPRHAAVDRVEVSDADPTGATTFEVRG